MRSTILCWSLGFLSISWLAGCSFFDRNNSCEKCSASNGGLLRKRVASATPTKQDIATAKAKTAKPDTKEVLPASAAGEPERLPEIPALPGTVPEGTPYRIEYPPMPTDETGTRQVSMSAPAMSMDPSKKEQNVVLKNVTFKYGHGANFESVTGQVQAFRKTLRLRYASIEQEDPYGGVVILEGDELSQLRDGQHVRLQGVFVPPSDRNGAAKYRVRSVEILD